MITLIRRLASAIALAIFSLAGFAQQDVEMPAYTITPEDGAQVYEISNIEMSFYGKSVAIADKDMIFLEDAQGEAVVFVADVSTFGSEPCLLIQPIVPISNPGDYRLIIGYGALKVDDKMVEEPITASWTVLAAADSWDGEILIDPANDSVVDSLHEIMFTFVDASEVLVDENAGPNSFPKLKNMADGTVVKAMVLPKDNTLEVALYSIVTIPGEYELTIPTELLKIDGAPLGRNIVAKYTIGGATAFEYTYSLDPAAGSLIGTQEPITVSFAAEGLKKIECNPYATTLDGSLPGIYDADGASVPCTITYGNDNFSFIVIPYYPIEAPGEYTLKVAAGYVTLYNQADEEVKNSAFSATYTVTTTGIKIITDDAIHTEIYKLDGTPAKQPLSNGIYIINGKQTLIHK